MPNYIVNIVDFVVRTTSNGNSELSSPLAVATQLHATADNALLNLETLATGENKALQATLQDIAVASDIRKNGQRRT